MTVHQSEANQFAVKRQALSYIEAFGDDSLGYCYFDYTYTHTTGTLNGQSVTVQIVSPTVTTGGVVSGVVDLPGGKRFSPWSVAGERAPVTYPTYSQRIRYVGHIRAVMGEYDKLMRSVGVTSNLYFDFGRISGGGMWEKNCPALLMPVSAVVTRTLDFHTTPAALTWIEFTVNFEQVGDFVAT